MRRGLISALVLMTLLLSACGPSSLSSGGIESSTAPKAGSSQTAKYSFPVTHIAPPGFVVGYEASNKDTVVVTGRLGSAETLARAGVSRAVVGCAGVDPASAVAVPLEWVITLESQRPVGELGVQFSPVISRSKAFLVDSLGQAYCPGVAAGASTISSLNPGTPLSMSFTIVIPHGSARSNTSNYLSDIASETLISGGPMGSLFPVLYEQSESSNVQFTASPPWGGSVIRCNVSSARFIATGWPSTGNNSVCPHGAVSASKP